MPHKLTPAARAAISDAVTRANNEGTSQAREEHLLAAVLADPASDIVLRPLNPELDVDAILAEVRRARRRAGLRAGEVEALAGLGINLDDVVGRVEAELGEGRWPRPFHVPRHMAGSEGIARVSAGAAGQSSAGAGPRRSRAGCEAPSARPSCPAGTGR